MIFEIFLHDTRDGGWLARVDSPAGRHYFGPYPTPIIALQHIEMSIDALSIEYDPPARERPARAR